MAKARPRWKKRPRRGIVGVVNDPIIYDRLDAAGGLRATVVQAAGGWSGHIVATADRCGPYGDLAIAKQSVVKRLEKLNARD